MFFPLCKLLYQLCLELCSCQINNPLSSSDVSDTAFCNRDVAESLFEITSPS
ncbi:hypothetical protein L6466_13465 [Prevotella communis]|uniref:hypothetical protein n=1 Tax=Prevotella communis TaxID=2913614 RepID=UPI001EDBB5E5|nr:hypothetical protein [Prevotella communis]UKK67552.1 hypothetical protein L6464_13200 [Prevotella communis]UKK70301.1 hypothetical protein L6466_13465 [Prevotella communis]